MWEVEVGSNHKHGILWNMLLPLSYHLSLYQLVKLSIQRISNKKSVSCGWWGNIDGCLMEALIQRRISISALAHNEYWSNSSRGENEHSEAQVNVLSWKKLNECNCYVSRIVYTFWALQREYSCLLLTLTNSEKSTIRFKTYPTCFWWMWPSFCPFSNFKMLIISSWDSHYRDKSHHITCWLNDWI